jgi:hypothetical protein
MVFYRSIFLSVAVLVFWAGGSPLKMGKEWCGGWSLTFRDDFIFGMAAILIRV